MTARWQAELGRYQVLGQLGRGSFATVWRALDTKLGREVALKVLERTDARAHERFQREMLATSRLHHPHLGALLDSGVALGHPYLVLELVPGEPLHAAAVRGLPIARAAEIVRDVARAVEHAHAQGVLHRDITPSNVLVGVGAGTFLIDFGLAYLRAEELTRLTLTGAIAGTPDFMAPEQAGGGSQADERTDVYGLGATLHYALTGAPPFSSPGLAELLAAIHYLPPDPPSKLRPEVPPALDAICLRCLAKDPAARFPGAGAVANALDAVLHPAKARPAHARSLALAVVVIGAVAAFAVGLGRQVGPSTPVAPDPPAVTITASPPVQATPDPTEPPTSGDTFRPRLGALVFSAPDRPLDELLAAFDELHDDTPDDERRRWVRINQARLALRRGRSGVALQRADELLGSPGHSRPELRYMRALALDMLGRRADAADERQTLEREGDSVYALLAAAATARGEGDDPRGGVQACALAERALRVEPANGHAMLELAASYAAAGRLLEAEPLLESVVAKLPDCQQALLLLGASRFQRRQLPSARATLDRAIELAGSDATPQLWFWRGATRCLQGEHAQADAELGRALTEPVQARVLVFRGWARKQLGRDALAHADWERARAVDPAGFERCLATFDFGQEGRREIKAAAER